MINLPEILGLPLFAWGGAFLLIILVFQTLTGLRLIKAKPNLHKTTGLVLVGLAIIHAIAGLSYILS